MFVATKLARIKSASLFVASPSGYARAAVAALGYEVRPTIPFNSPQRYNPNVIAIDEDKHVHLYLIARFLR